MNYDYLTSDLYSLAWERVVGCYAAGRYYEVRIWIVGSGIRGFL